MTAAAVTVPTGASGAPPVLSARPKSRSQRQRQRSYYEGFVDHREWLSEDDHRRAGRIHHANQIGWPAEIDEVLAEYGERLSGLSPDIIRTLYRQAKREVGGRDYLNERWLPYKQFAGTARATGRAGAGRAAPMFIRLIEELRRRGYRNWVKRGGGQRWLLDEWFEDQATLGGAIGRSRIVVNRLLCDPDMKSFVVKIPRRWFDCRVSGGATRNASLRYLFAIEDPLVPEDVEPIRARMRALLDERLRQDEEIRAERRDNAQRGGDNNCPNERETTDLGRKVPTTTDTADCDTQNAVSTRYTERSIKMTPQSGHSDRDNAEQGIRRSPHGSDVNAARQRDTPSTGVPLTTRTVHEETAGAKKEGNPQGPTGIPSSDRPVIGRNRRSNQEKPACATAELVPGSPLARVSTGRKSATRAPAERVDSAHSDRYARLRVKREHGPQEPIAGDESPAPAAVSAVGVAPPVGVDLAGKALLSEAGLRIAQTSHAVWTLACNLALDAEEQDQEASGRTPEEMRASAKCFASHVVGLLAASSAPYAAMTDFVYWIRRRAYRSARRDTQTGARVPWRNPGAYWTSVATGLACEAERSQWACATRDAEEELVSRLNAEAAAWERRTQEERQCQAEHEAERARWAQRATDYLAAEEHREEDRLTGDGNPDQDPDDGFGGWQRRQERRERRSQSAAPTTAELVEQLSEAEALAFLHRAMSDSVDDPQAPSRNQQPSRRWRSNPPEPSEPGGRTARGGKTR